MVADGCLPDCADGEGTITQHLSLSVNGGAFTDLGFNACTPGATVVYHDVTNVAPQRQLCYKLDAASQQQSSTDTRCITVPLDTTNPTAPILQVTPTPGAVSVAYTDQSINETRFRAWVCLVKLSGGILAGAVPIVLGDCALQQEINFALPNHSTGTVYTFSLSGLDPVKSYQVTVQAWHDHDDHGAVQWSNAFHPKPLTSAAPTDVSAVPKTDTEAKSE